MAPAILGSYKGNLSKESCGRKGNCTEEEGEREEGERERRERRERGERERERERELKQRRGFLCVSDRNLRL